MNWEVKRIRVHDAILEPDIPAGWEPFAVSRCDSYSEFILVRRVIEETTKRSDLPSVESRGR